MSSIDSDATFQPCLECELRTFFSHLIGSASWDVVEQIINQQNDELLRSMCKWYTMVGVCHNNVVPPDDIMLLLQDVINMQDGGGHTPLIIAVLKGNSPLILKFVEHGADITMAMNDHIGGNVNALCLALGERCWCYNLHSDDNVVIDLTSEAYAALINPSMVNNKYLFTAVRRDNIKAVKALIKAGADPAIKSLVGRYRLYNNLLQAQVEFYPFHEAFLSRVIVRDAAIMFQLIPQDVAIDSITVALCLSALGKRHRLADLPHIPLILSRILLAIKQDDFFTFHQTQIYTPCRFVRSTQISMCIGFEIPGRGFMGIDMFNPHLLYPLSRLLRKCVGAKRKPSMSEYSSVLTRYRAAGKRYHKTSTVEQSNAKYEEAAERMRKIDALFSDPLPLLNQCCFTIRRCLRYPKHQNLLLLPLPKQMLEKLMFASECRETCEQIKSGC